VTSPAVESPGATVCRLSLDPAAGRVRHRGHAGIAIRAALFAQLLLDGRLAGEKRPVPIGPSDTADRLADAVHRAVSARGALPWKRWFSHVGADVDAAGAQLQRTGAWQAGAARGVIIDNDPNLTTAQAAQVTELLALAQASPPAILGAGPGTLDATVALLAVGAGLLGARPRPKLALRRMDRLLPEARLLVAAGFDVDAQQDAVRTVVRTALIAMRRRAGSRLLSG
jgi:hypothetical protein